MTKQKGVMMVHRSRHTKFAILVMFLVVSATAARALPFSDPWGTDLQNIHACQRCAKNTSPNLVAGGLCGDHYGRGFGYPPLLFHSFRWLHGLTLPTAMYIWSVAIVLGLGLVIAIWSRTVRPDKPDKRSWELPIFGCLLILQYPSAFALERGGSDLWSLLLCSFGAWLMVRDRLLLSGIFFGTATAYKLYPIFACLVIGVGLLVTWFHRQRKGKRDWFWFGLGALVAFFGCWLIFWRDSTLYFRDVLTGVANMEVTRPRIFTHSIVNFVGPFKRFGWFIGAMVLALWSWAASRAFIRKDFALALAGSLALSTYFAEVGFDYNLTSSYPLLLVLFMRARSLDRWGLFALALFSVVADRQLFADGSGLFFNPHTHFALELGALILTAITVGAPPAQSAPQVVPMWMQRSRRGCQ